MPVEEAHLESLVCHGDLQGIVKSGDLLGSRLPGCKTILPPYSPDLNPIERAFAKLKAHLRRIGARAIDALCKAIGDVSALYSERACWNYFKDAGYAPD